MNALPIKRLRELLEIDAAQLAAELNISLPLVRKLEGGKRRITKSLRERLLDVYGVDVVRDELRLVSGAPFRRDFADARRELANNSLAEKRIRQGIQRDVELLVRSARNKESLHALAPHLHRQLRCAVARLGLAEEIENVRQAENTVSVGRIRAYHRAAPLRRRRDRLQRKLDQLSQATLDPVQKKAAMKAEAELRRLEERIAEEMNRINVKGRRRTIYHRFPDGQIVIIPPSVPNDKIYENPSYPEFGCWWPLAQPTAEC